MSSFNDFPFKKDYNLNINIEVDFWEKKDTRKKIINFSQATIEETIKEMWYIDKNWLDTRFKEKLVERWEFSKDEITIISMSIKTYKNIMNTILVSRYKWLVTMDSLDRTDTETEKKEEGWTNMPRSAVIVQISRKLSLDPLVFMNKYTFEQMVYLSEWITYLERAKTPKWQKENELIEQEKNWYNDMLLEKLWKF